MDKIAAQTSIKELNREIFSLSPSSLITLFEIDISDIGFDRGIFSQGEVDLGINTVFRFHNNVKLLNTSVFWQGKEYIAAPITAEGFETKMEGSLPTPKISITVSEDGIPYLAMLKDRIYQLGDIIGGKITRIRTMAKFIDEVNFLNMERPREFSPDPNAEFPRDVFYVDKKITENKSILEYGLASVFDVEGVQLPLRRVSHDYCPFSYRGQGCFYEYSGRRNIAEHGDSNKSVLPAFAPPAANEKDELLTSILSGTSFFTDFGAYNNGVQYLRGNVVYVTHKNINYYFIAKADVIGISPPNINYWEPDNCSRTKRGCSIRWGANGLASGNVVKGQMPFGGYAAVNKAS
jgi:lambda family phage minor tail protein L